MLRTLVFATVLLMCAPVASAQGPSATLELVGPGTDIETSRGLALVSVNATLRIQNVVCSSGSDLLVDVVGGAAQVVDPEDENQTIGNATVQTTPAQLRFNLGPGAYGNNPGLPAGGPYEATQSIAVSVESAGLPNVTVYTVSILATLPPATGGNCRGSGAIPGAEAETGFRVSFNETEVPITTSPRMPLPSWAAPLALVLVCWMLNRKRA